MPRPTKPLLFGNWKMNGLSPALAEVEAIGAALDRPDGAGVLAVVFPPNTLIHRARARAGARLAIGAQDCAVPASGAHTGDVSAEMLRDAGAAWAIVGHSERRAAWNEDDALVRAKAGAAQRAGLAAVVCVGETEAERDAGRAEDAIAAQVAGSVGAGLDAGRLVLAYEPRWAIGTGRLPSADDIAGMHALIRRALAGHLGPAGEGVAVLYGGSVKPDNAGRLMAVPGVDGFLVGGASLTAASFLALAAAMAGAAAPS